MPTFDHLQEPNLRAANERLQQQVAQIPPLLQRIGVLEVELRDARRDVDELTHANRVLQTEVNRWRAAYPDMTQKTTGVTT